MEGSAEDGTDEGAKWKKGEAVYPPGTVGAVRFSGAATIETIYRVCWDPLQTRKVYKW